MLTPAAWVWVVSLTVLHGGALALHWRSPRGAYQRLRPWAAVAYRMYGSGFGEGYRMLKLFCDQLPSAHHFWLGGRITSPLLEYVRHGALLAFASSSGILVVWAACLLRLR